MVYESKTCKQNYSKSIHYRKNIWVSRNWKKICFIVEKTSTKLAIKDAINTLYEQKALTVNTARTIYGKKAFVEFETVDIARDLATKIGML